MTTSPAHAVRNMNPFEIADLACHNCDNEAARDFYAEIRDEIAAIFERGDLPTEREIDEIRSEAPSIWTETAIEQMVGTRAHLLRFSDADLELDGELSVARLAPMLLDRVARDAITVILERVAETFGDDEEETDDMYLRTLEARFGEVAMLHDDCGQCLALVASARIHAAATGSTGGTFRAEKHGEIHEATVATGGEQ